MSFKMYEFEGSSMVWVCAKTKEQAIDIYCAYFGKEVWKEGLEIYGEKAVREMDNGEKFTYYEDEQYPDEDTIGNHIKKRCDSPDVFATSLY